MLNRFCPLSNPPIPLFLMGKTKLDGIPSKIKLKNTCLFVQCISCFTGISYKKIQDTVTSCFVSCCFTSAFPSADIIFYNFLEPHPTLKKFSFFNGFAQPPFRTPKSTKCDKFFVNPPLYSGTNCVNYSYHFCCSKFFLLL